MEMLFTLILKARLKPLAKKPPNGPMRDPKDERKMLWIAKGYRLTVFCKRGKKRRNKY